jgi:N-methylhydantoinase A/acetone carboxylase beta subunit
VEHKPIILAIDTGGTMSDTVVVDENGYFTIGKAQTTPENEAIGIINSFRDAVRKWNMSVEEATKTLEVIIYTGTIMLNRILTRTGFSNIGIITTAGHEDAIYLGRGRQSWITLPYAERLHAISHFHPEPLIPKNMVIGVRERILVTGKVMIPLYEHEVEKATRELIKRGARAIIIAFLHSWKNPEHELKAAEIVRKVSKSILGYEIPVYMSHRISPILGELGRLNAVVIQVYAAEPSREQLRGLQESFNKLGSKAPVYVLTNYGTMVPITYEKLVHTVNSGPTGGANATKWFGDVYGIDYVVGTDVGGTSFDVAMIIARSPVIQPITIVERFQTAVPSVLVESIGAGTGSYIRVDPITKALRVGPQSAGYRIGVSWREGNVDTVTINDAMVILGYINPDYFLGGSIKLDRKRAIEIFEDQVAKKLNVNVYDAAWGSYAYVCDGMRLHLEATILGRGFSPSLFGLVSYGGGGPLMVAKYTEDLEFAGVAVPETAPAFSAYGAALADFGARHEISTEIYVPPLPEVEPRGIAIDILMNTLALLDLKLREELSVKGISGMRDFLYNAAARELNNIWNKLKEEIIEEFKEAALDFSKANFRYAVRMLYAGMLDDIEVDSPYQVIDSSGLMEIARKFDDLFAKIYALGARSREFGYTITRAIVTGYLSTIKPKLIEEKESDKEPPSEAYKAERDMYWDGKWYKAITFEMGRLKSGNIVEGPAIIEAPATTFVIPPNYYTYLDRHRVFWLIKKGREIPEIIKRGEKK